MTKAKMEEFAKLKYIEKLKHVRDGNISIVNDGKAVPMPDGSVSFRESWTAYINGVVVSRDNYTRESAEYWAKRIQQEVNETIEALEGLREVEV